MNRCAAGPWYNTSEYRIEPDGRRVPVLMCRSACEEDMLLGYWHEGVWFAGNEEHVSRMDTAPKMFAVLVHPMDSRRRVLVAHKPPE